MNSTTSTALPVVSQDALQSWVDHLEITDALYRFAAGQDLRDATLFESAFASDAVLDFTQPAARFGVHLPPFEGRTSIVESIMAATSPLHTTHTVTNPRTQVRGNEAHLVALVEAQHVSRAEPTRHFLLKNIYRVDLVRDGLRWRMRTLRIENVWFEGDSTVLLKPA